jgi:hypothetical protein
MQTITGLKRVTIFTVSAFAILGVGGCSSSDGVRSAKDDITITHCGNASVDTVTVKGMITNSTPDPEGYWADVKALNYDGVVLEDFTVQVLGVAAGETRTFTQTEQKTRNGTTFKCVVSNATRTMGS